MCNTEQPLNSFIPKESLIKTLAKEKRDLQIENLELQRTIAVLQDDIAALKDYNTKSVTGHKDINKCVNSLQSLYGQLSPKLDAYRQLVVSTETLCELIKKVLAYCEVEQTEND